MMHTKLLSAAAVLLVALPLHAQPSPAAQGTPPQMMGGNMMGGMMGNAAAALPGRDLGQGARLVGEYCSQCHRAPLPGREPPLAWPGVISHMQQAMQAAGSRVRLPTATEVSQIAAYLEGHPWQ